MSTAPVVLTIAGSDCSAGAGVQADLKTCAAMGVHCLTAVTAVVAETPHEVGTIETLSPEFVCEQVAMLLRTYPVASLKTGMLGSAALIEALSPVLADVGPPLVVDPVLVASTGDALAEHSALEAYRNQLLPHARVITPNLPEAHALLGTTPEEGPGAEALAESLAGRFGLDVFLTGGHREEHERATDILVTGGTTHVLTGEWIDCPSSHGTGCTLSAALAARLACGDELLSAARKAKEFVAQSLRTHFYWKTPMETLALNQLSPEHLFDQGD